MNSMDEEYTERYAIFHSLSPSEYNIIDDGFMSVDSIYKEYIKIHEDDIEFGDIVCVYHYIFVVGIDLKTDMNEFYETMNLPFNKSDMELLRFATVENFHNNF
jgi:hypothetical protein